jgi:hypothetical protein
VRRLRCVLQERLWKMAAGHYVACDAAAAAESKQLRHVPIKATADKVAVAKGKAEGTPSTRATRGRQKDEKQPQQVQQQAAAKEEEQQLANGSTDKFVPPGTLGRKGLRDAAAPRLLLPQAPGQARAAPRNLCS